MPILNRLDPEFMPVVSKLPVLDLTNIEAVRAARAYGHVPKSNLSISHSDYWTPSKDNKPSVMLRIFKPSSNTNDVLPCLYWIQGGGYVITSPDLDDQFCEEIVNKHQCAVVSVDWRRAPEHPFPAALHDCYTGLAWIIENASQLQIDINRIVVGGRSSGGGSATSLALLIRDKGEFNITHQILISPMLDDTNSTPSSYMVTEPQLWNRTNNEIAWRSYLGTNYGTKNISPYAAPTRMTDLSGVAPATIMTGELDLFVDEDIIYANRLMQSNVSTELHVYRGAPHGFDHMVPTAQISQRFTSDRDIALKNTFYPQ